MRMLKAITLDLTGTLLTPHPSVGAVYAQCAKECGLPLSIEKLNQQFPQAFKSVSTKLAAEEFWREVIIRTMGDDLPYENRELVFKKCWTAFASAKAWRVTPGTVSALTALKFLGLKVALLSNADVRMHRVLKELNLEKYFDGIFLAPEMGCRKPELKAFQYAARALNVPLHALAHVGDHPVEDGEGAREAGALGIVMGGRHAPERCLRAENLADLPFVVRAVLTGGQSKGKFSRTVQNLLANLRGLPEDRGRSSLRKSVTMDEAVVLAFKKLRLDKPAPEDAIVAAWHKLLPLKLAKRCAPQKVLEDGRLIIQCESAIIKSEARFFERSLLEKIRQLPGCQQVRIISWVTA